MAVSATHTGWRRNTAGELELYVSGTLVATFTTTGVTWAASYAQTLQGAVTLPQALTIGGIAYTFPPDNGEAGEVLQTDGAGVLTWEADAVE